MAYDLEEQEQIDLIKAWWANYGNAVMCLLIVVLAGFTGWTYWERMQQGSADKASQLFDKLESAVTAKDSAQALRVAADIQDKAGKTIYAEMSALTVAKLAYDTNDSKTAKAQLQWVISNGSEPEYIAVAKVRLAGILLDEKSYDDALKLLSGDFSAEFAAVVADRKGDILVAQSKIAEARAAYQLALDKTDVKNPARQLIQVKLDAIGGASAKVPA